MSNLLPPNATPLEHAMDETIAASYARVDVPLKKLWNPDTCPVELLPWLAWAMSIDSWDSAWSEVEKRQVIKNSFYVHKHKGTVGAVKTALNASSVGITEWWQETPPTTPHTFRIDVEIENRGIDQGTLDEIERQITSVKPVRSHFTTRIIGLSTAMQYWGISVFSGETTEISPYAVTEIEAMPVMQACAIAYQDISTTTIYPQVH